MSKLICQMKTSNSALNKNDVRKHMRSDLAKLTQAEKSAESKKLCTTVSALPEWQGAKTVVGFVPMSDEPEILPLLSHSFVEGRLTGLVRLEQGTINLARFRPHILDSLESVAGTRLTQPDATAEIIPFESLVFPVVLLVPGLGFEAHGARLGRGGGWYDRLLASLCKTGSVCAIGVCFSVQLLKAIPTEKHDRLVNLVVAADQVYGRQKR